MKFIKKVVGQLEKCYALSKLIFQGRECFLVAGEKHAPCYVFDLEGNRLSTVWEEPGGVMTMVPLPGRDGAFLATHQFYSPNDSKAAMLVKAQWGEQGWRVEKLCDLPFLHRFDILERDGVQYLLACALKSGHEYKDDWRFPGQVFAGRLPQELGMEPLALEPVMSGLTRNHGYTRYFKDGEQYAVISCQSGVYLFRPPEAAGRTWEITQLIDEPASDAVLVDLDGDGEPELFVMSPFHGDQISIYRKENGRYYRVYTHPEKLPFLHAIDSGTLFGRPVVLCGNREGRRELLCFFYEDGSYRFQVVDADCGPANCLLLERNGRPVIVSANRETNEVAMYEVNED